ncbi:hypothetical protein lerEdw1_013812 [Lerista edwardsae]|nr:hypothetical protein lerEdw1_013812 [Lerista edwardsae]
MADSASESDTDGAGGSGSGGGGGAPGTLPGCPAGPGSAGSSKAGGIVISPFRLEELTNRLASLQQENKVLKIELETYKLKCKALQEENRDLRKASVTIFFMLSQRVFEFWEQLGWWYRRQQLQSLIAYATEALCAAV